MIIRSSSHSVGVATIRFDVALERGWFSQYPQFRVQVADPAGKWIKIQDFTRPELGFADIGPSVKTIQVTTQFPAIAGEKYRIFFFTRASEKEQWVQRSAITIYAGNQDIVQEDTSAEWQTYAKWGLAVVGLIAGGYALRQIRSFIP